MVEFRMPGVATGHVGQTGQGRCLIFENVRMDRWCLTGTVEDK